MSKPYSLFSKKDTQLLSSEHHVLCGQHAQLEALELGHVDALNEATQDGRLWELSVTTVPDQHGMTAYVEKALNEKKRGLQIPFVVRRTCDQKIVGTTRFYDINYSNRNRSIGFTWYSASAQNTLINTECKYMLLRHAFEKENCISVQWHTYHGNKRSQKAILRLGAKFEGVLRNHMILPDGRIRHTHCFSMLDSEWPKSKKYLETKLDI